MSRWVAAALVGVSAILVARSEPGAALALGWAAAAGICTFAILVSPKRWRAGLGWAGALIAVLTAVVTARDVGVGIALAAVAAAGAITGLRGGSWPGFSSRYQRGGAAEAGADTPRDLWESLDRGVDPTTGD